jgi:hypothetical protein
LDVEDDCCCGVCKLEAGTSVYGGTHGPRDLLGLRRRV